MVDETYESNIVRSFSGIGILKIDNKESIKVDFSILQHNDSSIIANCNACVSVDLDSSLIYKPVTLEGKIEKSSLAVTLKARIQRVSYTSTGKDGDIVLMGSHIRIGELPIKFPVSAHFHITNLEFSGTSFVLAEHNNGLSKVKRSIHCLPLTIEEVQVKLKQMSDYSENLLFAKETRSIAATTELSFSITQEADLEKVQEFADNICLILSLARGSRIYAMNCEIRNSSGAALYFIGRRLPRKGLGMQSIKVIDPLWPLGTQRFLEHCYTYICRANDEWAFDKAVDLYLDAKREGDEFELWGLKMVICMEFLHAQYLARVGEQTVLKPEQFNGRAQRCIKQHLEIGIRKAVEGITKEQIDAMLKKVKELNRPSFRDSLITLNSQVGARLSETAVGRFVAIRNSLVHRGTFCRVDKYGSTSEQYNFLNDYVCRFMFGILGNPLEAVFRDRTYPDGTPVSENYAQNLP